ncbi:MAG: enoyl-CoA hydratase/isomerase family protein [Chloroflexi bacterium]|nr:enoyl-CoA hydratase/isomerase family protein [Chloroflexota bacterium]
MTDDLLYEKLEGVAVLTLNRPDKMNAITVPMADALIDVVERVRRDDDVRVLVVTGAGKAFCAGADVSRLANRLQGKDETRFRSERYQPRGPFALALARAERPTIAAVNGAAVGAGMAIALACDIRIASETATFGSLFVRRAIPPDSGTSWFLPRIVGVSTALEMMYTGDIIDAARAKEIGLVSRVAPAGKLMEEVMALARKIASGPPVALELTRRAVYRGLVSDLASQFDYESFIQGIARQTEDHKEGVQAFFEKRQPRFTGR